MDLLQIIASNKLAIFPSNGNYVTKIIEEQKAFVESTAIESSDMNNNTETDNCNLDNLKDWQFPKRPLKSIPEVSESTIDLQTGIVPFKMISLLGGCFLTAKSSQRNSTTVETKKRPRRRKGAKGQ